MEQNMSNGLPCVKSKPLIIGIGGTTRPNSSSELAMQISLAAAKRAGAQVIAISGADCLMPLYAAEDLDRTPAARNLIDLVARCDGIILSTPSYHGSVSGMLKNALDYVEDLRGDSRPYFEGRAVGCIVSAAGWQGVGTTLSALRSIVHALRGWPTPLGVGFNSRTKPFGPTGECEDDALLAQLALLGEQVAQFAVDKAAVRETSRAVALESQGELRGLCHASG
jgi:FMN reductase